VKLLSMIVDARRFADVRRRMLFNLPAEREA
jgi:hypothetical protein